jgi:isopenicillin-N epimerase
LDVTRDDFLLDPKVCFLNHGSYGACPAEVFATYQDWQRKLEWQPVAFCDPGPQTRMNRAVREALAAFLNADPGDLVGVVNATEALNIVLLGLDLAPGDEIVTTDHEYGSMNKALEVLCARTGAVVRRVTVPLPLVSEAAFADTVLAGFSDRTRVLFLSHITSPTALMFPLDRVLAQARARGVLSVIDGAHGPGQIPLDLTALGADVYAGNCHKWLMSPKGAAFLHMAKPLQEAVTPRIVSHGWQAGGGGPYTGSTLLDRIEMQGTRDRAAWFTVPKAIEWRQARDWDAVAARCRDLAWRTAERVSAMSGYPLLSSEDFRAPQMAALEIPVGDMPALHDRMLRDFGIEMPAVLWNGRCFLRLSVAGYTTEADCDHLVTSMAQVFGWGPA